MNPYTNLTEALAGLICQGYNINFVLEKDYLKERNSHYKINLSEFEVQHVYTFEDADPKFNAIIYGVSSEKHNVKGIIISSDILVEKSFPKTQSKLIHQSVL